jgi:hypothetical protein
MSAISGWMNARLSDNMSDKHGIITDPALLWRAHAAMKYVVVGDIVG